MKKKKVLRKVTMATGVVVMSIGLFNSFDLEAQSTGGGLCCPEIFVACWPGSGNVYFDARWEPSSSSCKK